MDDTTCEACKVNDITTVHERGVYACYECQTLYNLIWSGDPMLEEALDAFDAFAAEHPDWKQR